MGKINVQSTKNIDLYLGGGGIAKARDMHMDKGLIFKKKKIISKDNYIQKEGKDSNPSLPYGQKRKLGRE